MSGLYLLDSNAVSDLVRNPRGPVRNRAAKVGASKVCTSIVVAAELRYGAAKSTSLKLSQQLRRVLAALPVLPLEPPVDEIYGALRADLERIGNLIGPNDLFVAAHALALDHILVTDNMREFSRVPNLRLENWIG
jgi:tRNA(fMet)-specific endonuclease VapC